MTPLRIHLSAGKHSVLLTNPDKQIRKTIHVDIKANHTVHKRLSLTP